MNSKEIYKLFKKEIDTLKEEDTEVVEQKKLADLSEKIESVEHKVEVGLSELTEELKKKDFTLEELKGEKGENGENGKD